MSSSTFVSASTGAVTFLGSHDIASEASRDFPGQDTISKSKSISRRLYLSRRTVDSLRSRIQLNAWLSVQIRNCDRYRYWCSFNAAQKTARHLLCEKSYRRSTSHSDLDQSAIEFIFSSSCSCSKRQRTWLSRAPLSMTYWPSARDSANSCRLCSFSTETSKACCPFLSSSNYRGSSVFGSLFDCAANPA